MALRLSTNGRTGRPTTGQTRPLPDATSDGADLRRLSRERYGVARREVEAGLLGRLQVPHGQTPEFGKRPRREGGRR